jgi:glucose/mannose-6-phosphate isomerase
MREKILSISHQISQGLELGSKISLTKDYENIIFCGMGGSLLPAKFLSFEHSGFILQENYGLPSGASSDDLVVCTSWSGNTAETISAYQEAHQLGADILVITKLDSSLGKLAKQNDSMLVEMPEENIRPRLAIGYMLGATVKALGLESELADISLSPETLEKQGKEIAEKIGTKTPIFYSTKLNRLAEFWKILVNENCKVPAFWNEIPAALHDEIAGFNSKLKDNFIPVIFTDETASKEIKKDVQAMLAFLEKIGYTYITIEVSSSSDKTLAKVLNNYILGLWTTLYLSEALGIDPQDTSLIEQFKKFK